MTLGNTIGGVLFIAIPNYFQTRDDRFREWERLTWPEWVDTGYPASLKKGPMQVRNYMCLLLVALVMSWAACASPDSPMPEATPAQDLQPVPSVTHNAKELFERNQARWKAQNLREYQFTFRRQVIGSTESTGPVVITVSNGRITGARAAVGRGLGTVDPDQEDLYVIDSLFAYLGQVLEAGVDSLVIRYDAEFGFPYFAYVDDHDHEHTTAETTFEVRDFFPLARKVSTDSLRTGA